MAGCSANLIPNDILLPGLNYSDYDLGETGKIRWQDVLKMWSDVRERLFEPAATKICENCDCSEVTLNWQKWESPDVADLVPKTSKLRCKKCLFPSTSPHCSKGLILEQSVEPDNMEHLHFKEARLHGFLCLALLSALCALVVLGCSTEPVWEGRRLSDWLAELTGQGAAKSDAAETALTHIGTNAIPYLFPKLTAPEDSPAKSLRTHDRVEVERTGAVLTFRMLGSSAAQALPRLGMVLTNQATATNPVVAHAITQSIAGVGEQGIPLLVAALNHPSRHIRFAGLVGLIDLGEKARDTMPCVLERLKDDDAEIRGVALYFVNSVSQDPDTKLRVLKEATQDSDGHVRSFAGEELKKLDIH